MVNLADEPTHKELKQKLENKPFNNLRLKWLCKESLGGIFSFGRPLVDTSGIEINTLASPVLPTYYNRGNWSMF